MLLPFNIWTIYKIIIFKKNQNSFLHCGIDCEVRLSSHTHTHSNVFFVMMLFSFKIVSYHIFVNFSSVRIYFNRLSSSSSSSTICVYVRACVYVYILMFSHSYLYFVLSILIWFYLQRRMIVTVWFESFGKMTVVSEFYHGWNMDDNLNRAQLIDMWLPHTRSHVMSANRNVIRNPHSTVGIWDKITNDSNWIIRKYCNTSLAIFFCT